MAYDIGPRVGVEGEADFRRQLRQVNDDIRTMGSEMNAVTSEFIGHEKSMDAYRAKSEVLTRQIGAQEDKLKLLTDRLERAKQEYDEGDDRINRYQREVYNATTQLNKMQAELKQTEKAMDDLGDETKESTGLFDKLKDKVSGFDLKGALVKGFAAGTIVNGIKEIGGAVADLVDNTREYRSIMGTLDAATRQWGYGVEETEEAYTRLYGVLGDPQTTATTLQNLMAVDVSQQELLALIDQTTGAWAQYGDSIPIDGLAEAINETIKAGQVTGVFADVLNWGSKEGETFGVTLKENVAFTELSKNELEKLTDQQREEYEATKAQYDAITEYNKGVQDATTAEDKFNIALQNAQTEQERLQLVMQALSEQGLEALGQDWRDLNKDIVDANESQQRLEAAMARLGGKFEPLVAGFRSLAADGINFLIDAGEGAFEFFSTFPSKAKQIGGDILTGLWNGINNKVAWLKQQVKGVVDKIKGWFTGSDGFDTHSPSKWSEKVFMNVMEGGAIGVNRGTGSMLKQVDAAVNAVKHDLSSVSLASTSVPNIGTSAGGSGVDPDALAYAVKTALIGTGVYLEGRKVGQIVTTQQNNTARSWGTSPVYG